MQVLAVRVFTGMHEIRVECGLAYDHVAAIAKAAVKFAHGRATRAEYLAARPARLSDKGHYATSASHGISILVNFPILVTFPSAFAALPPTSKHNSNEKNN